MSGRDVGRVVWLDVGFDDKDEAKAAGARWDGTERRWYVTAPTQAVARWMPLPDLLPGEDRSFGSGLFVDLVPRSCWFTNVRSCVSSRDWDRLRRMVYRRAGDRCESCAAAADPSSGLRLEAHERWAYDENTSVQRLVRLVCLCSPCHSATHYGLAQLRGRDAEALAHLMRVNSWNVATAEAHVNQAMEVWRDRSARHWTLDLSMLTGAGVTPRTPPSAGDRAAHAERSAPRED